MPIRVQLGEHSLDVEIRGWDVVLCLSHDQHVPLALIRSARVTGWNEVFSQLGWRVGGGYWPGRFATGWYTVPSRPGARQFLAVFRDRDQLLVIDTELERPCRLVLAVPDAARLAEQINAQLRPFG